MGRFRTALPQLGGGLFLADGGGEENALRSLEGRAALRDHLLGLLELAGALDAGFILDAPVHRHDCLPVRAADAELADLRAIAFVADLREEAGLDRPVVLNAALGPGPGWSSEWRIVADEGERLFVSQLGWLAASGIDMVSSPAFGSAARAIGFIETVLAAGLPLAVTFAIGPTGRLPDGQPLGEAIEAADAFTGAGPAWFTVQCVDPAHLLAALAGREGWARRLRGLRIEAPFPDHAAPASLRATYDSLAERAPWLAIADLAGGRNLRHAAAMARALHERERVAA